MSIEVFEYERRDGLALLVSSNASVAYLSEVVPHKPESDATNRVVAAKTQGDYDYTLYPIDDVLVTSGENKNTDFFDKGELWAARHSSKNKQLNFEHDEKRIIGHIIDSRPVDESYADIPDDTNVDDLPDKFHILNHSVIYATWADEETQELIDDTIEEIEAGEWFVSMECLFQGFDYVVTLPDGAKVVVARNEESAFLTKHLRQYGGSGVYVDKSTGSEYKLARFLKNITFSGKGLVRKPANPESVILNNNEEKSSSSDLGYVISETSCGSIPQTTENLEMPEISSDVKLLQDRVAALETENVALRKQSSEAAQAKVTELEAGLSAKATEITQLKTQLDATKDTIATLTQRAESAEKAKAEVETELNTVKASQKRTERFATLVEKGAAKEQAESLVAKFENLTDDQFGEMVSVLSAAFKKEDDKKDDDDDDDKGKAGKSCDKDMPNADDDADAGKKDKEEKKGKATDLTKVVDNATPVAEPNLSTASEPEEGVRAKASEFIGNFLKYSKAK